MILVAGATGLVGGMIARALLAQGRTVRTLVRDGSGYDALVERGAEPALGDLKDPSSLARACRGARVVVTTATAGQRGGADTPESVDLDGNRHLIDAAVGAGVERFVFASTCSNYGRLNGQEVATEEWSLNPVSLYAETKVAAELDVLSLADDAFAPTCLRFATVYGSSPRMRFDLTVNEFTRDAYLARELVVYGEQFWRPYIHIEDAAAGVVTVLEADRDQVAGEVFNVGDTGENYRKLDLVALLEERVPQLAVEYVQKDEDPRDYRVSFDKIAAHTGFAVRKRVPDGIDEVGALVSSGLVDPFAAAFRN